MDASENNAFPSSWMLLRAVPLGSLSVAGGRRGGSWLGISGSNWEAIRPNSFRCLGLVCWTLGGESGLHYWPCPHWRHPSLHRVVEPGNSPGDLPVPWFSTGRFCSPGNIWSSQLGEGCSWHPAGRGRQPVCPAHRTVLTAKEDPAQNVNSVEAEEPSSRPSSPLPSGIWAFEVQTNEVTFKSSRGFQATPPAYVALILRMSCLSRKRTEFPGRSQLPS